ncbi:MAG TPA: insulinase family protein [Kofleriaceae bacterium]|nr:insulinase family protein [Kofleriaceae bacterium]
MTAIQRLDSAGLRHALEGSLAISHAKVIVLQPDGARPVTQSADLIEPHHMLRRPLELDAESVNVEPRVPPSVLAHARTLRLANGLSVILAPSSTVPVVHVHLVFGAGMTTTPLRRVASTAIAALVRAIRPPRTAGLSPRWVTGMDTAEITVSIPATELEADLTFFGELPTASDSFSDAVAKIVADVRPNSIAADAKASRDDDFYAHIYGDHPYGTARREDSPSAAPMQSDVETFYRQFLQPDNATLIVTGGFDVDAVEPIVRRIFTPWTGSAQPHSLGKPMRQPGAAFAINEATPWIALRIGWLAGPPDDDYAARQIIAAMIDRLMPRVRCAHLAYRVASHYEVSGRLDPQNAATDIVHLRDAIAALADGSDASKQLFAVARREVAIGESAGATSSAAWATELTLAVAMGHDLAWRQQLAQRAAKVSYDDVKRLIAEELSPSAATWVLSGPGDKVAEIYARLGLTVVSE